MARHKDDPHGLPGPLERHQQILQYRQRALDTLGELLDSDDDNIRLQSARFILELYKDDGKPLKKLKKLLTRAA